MGIDLEGDWAEMSNETAGRSILLAPIIDQVAASSGEEGRRSVERPRKQEEVGFLKENWC